MYGISIDVGTSGTRVHALDLDAKKIISTAMTVRHPVPGANDGPPHLLHRGGPEPGQRTHDRDDKPVDPYAGDRPGQGRKTGGLRQSDSALHIPEHGAQGPGVRRGKVTEVQRSDTTEARRQDHVVGSDRYRPGRPGRSGVCTAVHRT